MQKQWKQWQIILLGSKISADGDCSHEIKRYFLIERKAMTNLDSILKSRDITLPTKVCIVQAMVFPIVMYGCESWTIKKVECWRIDAFFHPTLSYLIIINYQVFSRTSLVAQTVKHLLTLQEIWVQSLGQEDILEKAISSILASAHPSKKRGLKEIFFQGPTINEKTLIRKFQVIEVTSQEPTISGKGQIPYYTAPSMVATLF